MEALSLADLSLFVRVSALGTLSAAARERGVPVSHVSRTMDRIERNCGIKLIRRSARGMSLTHDGEAFLAFCQKVGTQRADLEADLARWTRHVSGRTRLSVSGVIAHFWVVPSLPQLARTHPQLALDLLVDDEVVDLAREGVDIAIRTGEPALPLVCRPLGSIATGLYASEGYLARHGSPRQSDDLSTHALLANCEHPVLNRLRFRSGRTLLAEGALRSGSTAVLAQMAAAGLGIAHLPVHVAAGVATNGGLRPVLAGEFESADIRVSAMLLPDRQRLPRVRACIDHLMHVFAR